MYFVLKLIRSSGLKPILLFHNTPNSQLFRVFFLPIPAHIYYNCNCSGIVYAKLVQPVATQNTVQYILKQNINKNHQHFHNNQTAAQPACWTPCLIPPRHTTKTRKSIHAPKIHANVHATYICFILHFIHNINLVSWIICIKHELHILVL